MRNPKNDNNKVTHLFNDVANRIFNYEDDDDDVYIDFVVVIIIVFEYIFVYVASKC